MVKTGPYLDYLSNKILPIQFLDLFLITSHFTVINPGPGFGTSPGPGPNLVPVFGPGLRVLSHVTCLIKCFQSVVISIKKNG